MTTLLQFISWMQNRVAALKSGSDRGAAAVEYGLLVALIAVAILFAVYTLGNQLNTTFTCVGTRLANASSASGSCSN